MIQQEHVPVAYQDDGLHESNPASIQLRSSVKLGENKLSIKYSFEAITPQIYRTTFTSSDHPLPPWPSARKPTLQSKDITVKKQDGSLLISHGEVRAKLAYDGLPLVSVGYKDQAPMYEDLPFRSYAVDGTGIAHYTKYHRGDLHVGLGEKAAPMDLSNRHFTLSATDCFGYDVYNTDPMYKHIPLLIRATPDGVVATFSTSHARGFYSIGSEMDGMWGRYKVYRQDHGGLELYIMLGKTLQEVVKLYADLVGYPLLVPRWAAGILLGGMKFSMLDEPPAVEALTDFADKLIKHDMPCSGFQLSSGYTVAETEPKTRNVFTWNKHRFPDPKAFVQDYRNRGIRLIANIKPYVLASHPDYEKLVAAGALFKDMNTGNAGIARLWSAGGGESGEGGHIDMTSKTGYTWWCEGVKALRELGIDCPWNDNNEYLVPDDTWQCSLDAEVVGDVAEQRKDIGLWGRALHCELMGKSSHDALIAVAPHERPFVLTRSATAGTMRYCASSWSGDNVTSWEGMRGANAISLNAGVSLLQCFGEDIAGFEGPQPSPELLLRWIQLGIHSSRFAINCFKTGNDNLVGDVIEPWMYPEIIPEVRAAFRRRYELIPYIYNLMLQSHRYAYPPKRWVGWGYENDAEIWTDKTLKAGDQQYWFGDALMIGGVYEPGVTESRVYLPHKGQGDAGYLNTNPPHQYLASGQWHTISSPWKTSIPIIARIGGAVPVGTSKQTVAPGDKVNQAKLPADDWRGVEIYPSPRDRSDGTRYSSTWYEDDGISPEKEDNIASFNISYAATKENISISFEASIKFEPPWYKHGLTIILPVGDDRPVIATDDWIVTERTVDEAGHRRYDLHKHS